MELDPPIPSLTFRPVDTFGGLCAFALNSESHTMDDQSIIQRATRAYHLRCRREGTVYMQPAARACRVALHEGAHYAVLANGCGDVDDTLAIYRLEGNPCGDYRLVGLPDLPQAVSAAPW